MDNFDKNMKALMSENSKLVKNHKVMVQALLQETNVLPDTIQVIDSPIGHKVMLAKNTNGDFIQYNSLYDIHEECDYLLKDIKKDYFRRMIVVVGVGMGYHIKALHHRINEKSFVIIIEKNIKMLKAFFTYHDFAEEIRADKFVFIWGDFPDVTSRLRGFVNDAVLNIKDVTIITLPIVDVAYIRYCRQAAAAMENSRVNLVFNMGNDTGDTLIGIRHNFINMHEMLSSCGISELMKHYQDEYKGKPAIVVASGPSLNKNIHLLKSIQNKALILACDGSLKPLLENGIIPHAVLSVERVLATYERFYKDKQFPESLVLIAPPVVRPEIFDCFPSNRKIIPFKRGEGVNEWMQTAVENKGSILCGASVAHLCFSFANAVHADPIILVGQDLAYSRDGDTHGKGVPGGKKIDLNSKKIVYVKDYDGKDLPSSYVMKNFLIQLESFIKISSAKCIDATEGGSYKEGAEIMKLSEAIDKYCHEEIPSLHTIVEKHVQSEVETEENYNKLLKLLNREIKNYELNRLRIKKYKRKIDKIEKNSKKYTKSNAGLDTIFNLLSEIDTKFVKRILRNPLNSMMFQTEIRNIAFEVSDLGKNVEIIDGEILMKNIQIQKKMFNIFDKIMEKMVDTFMELKIIMEAEIENLKVKELV